MTVCQMTESPDLTFSIWHRITLDIDSTMIDIDGAHYCRRCYKILFLLETAIQNGHKDKETGVLESLAKEAKTLAFCIMWTPKLDEKGNKIPCHCQVNTPDKNCSHGIEKFKWRRVHPDKSLWTTCEPPEMAARLMKIHDHHHITHHAPIPVAA